MAMNSMEEYVVDGTSADVIGRYARLSDFADWCDFGELDTNVVVVDTETTGLSYSRDELIQIAAARLEKGEIVSWYTTYVDPGVSIPEDIVRLTGIHDEDVAGAPSPDEALSGLADFAQDAIMVAHNVDFDRTFVTAHPAGYSLLENIWVDSLDLSRIALPRLKSHRLIDLVHTFGAPVSTHRADDDVAATCVVYRILLAAVASMPRSLVAEIGSMGTPDTWSTRHVFAYLAENWDEITTGTSRAERSDDASSDNGPDVALLQEKELPSGQEARPLFSVHALRRSKLLSLPARKARVDADDLVGNLAFPSSDEVAAAFAKEGVLGAIYGDYEAREEQRTMALAIADAMAAGENLVVEAGTGVGKSMAYLVPHALFAQRNGVAVGIATKTNSLLDQLVFQELPALSKALKARFPQQEALTWASLKGMAHYPCLRKIQHLVDDGPGLREVTGKKLSQAPALAGLLSFIEQSEYDDLDSLKIDYRALPRYLFTTTSHECLRRKCPFFGKLCFVHGARRRAETADVVVTNHTLLFCDLAADGGLLPNIRHWVVDEAHSAENEARAAFARTVDSEALAKLAARVNDASGGRNVFERAVRSVSKVESEQLTLFFRLVSKARSTGNDFARQADDYLMRVKDMLFFDPTRSGRKGQSYDKVDIWINQDVRHSQLFGDLVGCVDDLIDRADKLIRAASDLVAYLEGIDEAAAAQREVASCVMELRDFRNAAEVIFEMAPETYAYQARLHRKKERRTDKTQALLLDVGDTLNETLYARTQSVVFASATLTVAGKFDSFLAALGLGRGEFSPVRCLQLDSSYDFDNNMVVYVVSDMPEPNDPGYADALNRLLVEAHRAQRGSMLTLFTNRREMERSYKVVNEELKKDNLHVVCQKYGLSVKGLRDEFVADEHLSLFALKSFWEGFDAPGATLKGVVIPKLPFARPTDPLYCERAARDDRAWWHYVLPQAVIETKQAAGRLIRKADDHGVLILADKRLLTKSYGKTFLGSLQSRTVRVCTADEVVASLRIMGTW